MNDKVTVIIPFFNMEKYLNRSILSIISQTYESIEIVLINDGSDDGSEEICKELMKKDNRIIYIYQEKKGVSAARNKGIDVATGKYLLFVDADDFIESGMIETYVNEIKCKNSDLIISEYKVCNGGRTSNKYSYNRVYMNIDEAYSWILTPNGMKGTCWAKMFKTDIVKNNSVRFNEEIRFCEDLLFVYQYIKYINSILYLPDEFYNYCVREDSTMGKRVESIDDPRLDIVKVIKFILDETSKDACYYKMLRNRLVISAGLYMSWCVKLDGYEHMNREFKKMIRPYMNSFLVSPEIDLKTKISIFLRYFFPRIMYNIKGNKIKRMF